MKNGWKLILAAALLWSFGGVCIKLIPWGALSVVGLRSALAAGVFIVYRRSARVTLSRANLLAGVCLSGTIFSFVLATQLTTAAAAIALQFTSPVFIILLQALAGRRPTWRELSAVTVTLGGMALFFVGGWGGSHALGNLLGIVSGVFFAGVFFCNRLPGAQPDHSLLIGFMLNAVIGLPFVPFQVTADPRAWASILAMGTLQVGLAYVLFARGIRRTDALTASLLSAVEPVLNPVWVWLAVGEQPGPYALLGGVIIVAAVAGYNILAARQARSAENTPPSAG